MTWLADRITRRPPTVVDVVTACAVSATATSAQIRRKSFPESSVSATTSPAIVTMDCCAPDLIMARASADSVSATANGRDPRAIAWPRMRPVRIRRAERFAQETGSASVASACARQQPKDVTRDSTVRSAPPALAGAMSSGSACSVRCTRRDRWAKTRSCAPRTARSLCRSRRRRLKVSWGIREEKRARN